MLSQRLDFASPFGSDNGTGVADMSIPFKSFIGQRMGTRVITRVLRAQDSHGARWVQWRCDCGKTGKTTAPSFRKTLMCRRCATVVQRAKVTRHGDGSMSKRLYRCWRGMICRTNGTHGEVARRVYAHVSVCPEWQTYEGFRTWALANGYADHLTLDRIYSCRDYTPLNCEWVSKTENSRRAKRDIWRRYEATPIEMLWGTC